MVAENIPCHTNARIEVLVVGRIGAIGIRDVHEIRPERRSHNVVKKIVDLDRIAFPFITQAKIDRQPAGKFPIVLNIRLHSDISFRAIAVGSTVRCANKQEGIALQEVLIAQKNVVPIPEDLDERIELLPLEHAADVQRVGTLGPGEVVFFGELVLKIFERVHESCPQWSCARYAHIDVLSRG